VTAVEVSLLDARTLLALEPRSIPFGIMDPARASRWMFVYRLRRLL